MPKRKAIYKWSIASATLAGFLGIASYGIVALYNYSQEQSNAKFVDTLKTNVDKFFDQNTEPEIRVVKKTIAGEEGYSVNKGPVRIESAYKAIFDEDSLKELANWVYRNVPWGANGVSLNTITFTTGIDSNINSVTLGYHTSDRAGSSIYLSPDAFEMTSGVSADVYAELRDDLEARFIHVNSGPEDSKPDGSFVSAARMLNDIEDFNKISGDLDRKMLTNFNGVDFGGLGTAKYTTLTKDQYFEVWSQILREASTDNYFTVKDTFGSAISLNQITKSTIWGDGLLTDPARLAVAKQRNQLPKLVNQFLSRFAAISAWKLLVKSTATGKNANNEDVGSLAETFLRVFMQSTFFEESEVFADGSRTYKVIDRDRWDDSWKEYSNYLLANGTTQAGVDQRGYAFQLFKEYYDLSLKALTTPLPTSGSSFTLEDQIVNYFNDPSSIIYNFYTRITNTYSKPGDRIRFILQGKLVEQLRLSVLKSDAFLLNRSEQDILSRKIVTDRYLDIDSEQFLASQLGSSVITRKNGLFSSIPDAFRFDLLETMRYTIAHEYGHHETIWQTHGNYDQTYYTNTEQKRGAKSTSPINAALFKKLESIASTSSGVKSVVDIVKRSNDKFSSTWTPSVYSSGYFGYYPVGDEIGWSSQYYQLWKYDLVRVNNSIQAATGFTPHPDSVSIPIRAIESGADGYQYSNVTQNSTPDSLGNVNPTNVSPFVYYIDLSKLPARHPFRIAPRPEGATSTNTNSFDTTFSKFATIIPLNLMLESYQQTKWTLEGRTQESVWAINNGIKLYKFNSNLSFSKPTIKYAGLSNPINGQMRYLDLATWIAYTFSISTEEANQIIELMNEQVGELYDSLVASYPNMFEIYGNLPKMSDYQRNLLITKRVIGNTQQELGNKFPDRLNLRNFGIYYDPNITAFRKYRDFESADQYWSEHNNNSFITEGTISIAGAEGINGMIDYTGSYPEFLTRFWNQLTFRPSFDQYLTTITRNGTSQTIFDSTKALKFNDGWYEDTNRFIALGMPLYNYRIDSLSNVNNGDTQTGLDSGMTEDGAKLLIWSIEMLGVHSSLDLTKQLPRTESGLIDFDAIDNSLVSANVLEKVYKNRESDQYSMWGWLTPEQAAKYNYIAIKNTRTGQYVFKPIYTKNTSNYFYYEDMTNIKRRNMIKNFVQWTSEWFIAGEFTNADLNNGEYEIFFSASQEIAKVEKLITSNFQNLSEVVTRSNNDYEKILARIEATIDPIERRVTFKIKE